MFCHIYTPAAASHEGRLADACIRLWKPNQCMLITRTITEYGKINTACNKSSTTKTNFVLLSLTEINLIRVYCHICAYAKVLVPHMSIIKCGASAKLRINGKTTDMQCGNSEET